MAEPIIPEYITVHLGNPDDEAENVTVSFPDYIKNVASSEIYPTWPTEALIANIRAQISVALNRVYTEYYRSRGKPFDITSSTAFDQSFVYQRDIYENISKIVDEIFDSYVKKDGFIEPLYATFCDGVKVQCNGLSQWGSVELANQGLSAEDILKRYYGNDVTVVKNVEVSGIRPSAPAAPLRLGDTGRDIENVQIRLNRISANYPGIPKIPNTDGFFDRATEEAVKEFQRVFGLTDDGIVGNATWYKIQYIYNAVKRLFAVNSEGLKYSELPSAYPGDLRLGERSQGVLILQYYLEYISLFVSGVQSLTPDGIFGIETENAVKSFERTYGLPVTGIVDRALWTVIQSTYYNILGSNAYKFDDGIILPYPGRVLTVGASGEDVRALQEYLLYIRKAYPAIPELTVDGVFGGATERAVIAFNNEFGIEGNPARVNAQTWNTLTSVYEDIYLGNTVRQGQFPGYTIGE